MSQGIAKSIRYGLIFIVLIVVLLLAAPFFIDVNNYKGQIEQQVEDATGRKLTIGSISASLFPWVGVELDQVRLANREGYSKHDLISVQKLHVKLALMPLLSKQVEIKHFEIVAPKLYLERRANGENNWSDLMSSPSKSTAVDTAAGSSAPAVAATEGQPAAGVALAALQAESLTLSGGELIWVDGQAKPVALTELDVELKDVQLDRPVAIRLSGKLDNNAFNLDANVGPLGDLNHIDPIKLPLQGNLTAEHIALQPFAGLISGWPEQLGDINKAVVGVKASLEQRPDGLRMGKGVLTLDAAHDLAVNWQLKMPSADLLKLQAVDLAVDGQGLLHIKGDVKLSGAKPSYTLHVDSEPLKRTWLSGFVPALNDMYAGHPSPWDSVAINALLAGNDGQLDIRDMQLKLDKEVLKLAGNVVFAGPDIRLRINGTQLHLDPWLPQGKDKKTASLSLIPEAIAVESAAEPDLRFLKDWRVTAQMKVGVLHLQGLEMGAFTVSINGNGGRFDMNPLSFNLARGRVVEKASINVAAYPVRWTESVHIEGVQAGPLLKTLADMDMLTGTMAMDTRLKGTGLTEAGVNTLNGRGEVMLRDGKLKGYDIAGAIRQFTQPGAAAGPKETDFAQLSGSFTIVDGVANNQDLFMVSPLLRVTGKGTVNLVQKMLDYHVTPRVVGSLKGQGDAGMRKGLSVPLHITGAFDAPKIRPEINAKTLLDNAPALLEKGNIGGALGKILGGTKTPADGKPQSEQLPVKQLLKGFGF